MNPYQMIETFFLLKQIYHLILYLHNKDFSRIVGEVHCLEVHELDIEVVPFLTSTMFNG